MANGNPYGKRPRRWQIGLVILGLLASLALAGCGFAALSPEQATLQAQLRETELELNVRQTLQAQQASLPPPANPPPVLPATAVPTVAIIAPEATPTQPPPPPAEATAPPETVPPQAPATLGPEEMQQRLKDANILLYEDMVGRLDTNRYVKDALEYMGLAYKDVGSAKGWLKEALDSGPGNGKPWDLVIIALEDKNLGAQGEFFEYALQAIERDANVILEVWYLDRTYTGSASTLLERCGVRYQADRKKIPPARMVMFAIDPDNPLLNAPNTGLSFTDTLGFWWDSVNKTTYDTGDLVEPIPGKNAIPILGVNPDSQTSHVTLTECMDGRLILQTFSSHTLTYNADGPLWENMIYNALRNHFSAAP